MMNTREGAAARGWALCFGIPRYCDGSLPLGYTRRQV